MNKNINRVSGRTGFTLIELMVSIAIIAVLAAIILASLNSAKKKSNDSKITSYLKSMVNQSQLFLGTNASIYSYVTLGTPVAITTPIANGTNLFDSSTPADNSLQKLINALPAGTVVYYASEAVSPISGGKWALAASTSNGSVCIDYTTALKIKTGTVMTTAASPGASSGPTLYPNLLSTGSPAYSCN